jgi:hypothetical protein
VLLTQSQTSHFEKETAPRYTYSHNMGWKPQAGICVDEEGARLAGARRGPPG